jgi:hypothetical protein
LGNQRLDHLLSKETSSYAVIRPATEEMVKASRKHSVFSSIDK